MTAVSECSGRQQTTLHVVTSIATCVRGSGLLIEHHHQESVDVRRVSHLLPPGGGNVDHPLTLTARHFPTAQSTLAKQPQPPARPASLLSRPSILLVSNSNAPTLTHSGSSIRCAATTTIQALYGRVYLSADRSSAQSDEPLDV